MNRNDENESLPEGWAVTTMGRVAAVVGGGTPKTTTPGNFSDDEGHPWLTPSDLTGYRQKRVSRGRRNLTDQGLAGSAAKYMPAGTILFSSRAPIGYVAIASNPIATNQGFRSFVPSDALDSDFAFHYLKSITPLAEQLASGTTFNELSGSKAKTLPLRLPPVAEQRRIAERLDEVDECRASVAGRLQSARASVEQFRGAVLAAACTGQLTADWREANQRDRVAPSPALSDAAADHASGAPNTHEFTDIPEAWLWWTIESITELVIDYRGRTPPVDAGGTIPHIRTTQIRNRRIDWNADRFVTRDVYDAYMTRGLPLRGDVLFTMEAPMGEVAVVDRDEPFSIAQRILLLRPRDDVTGEFLALALQSLPVRRAMEYRATGTGVLGIAYKRLRSLAIPKPPREEQVEIARRAEAALGVAERLVMQIERIAATLDDVSRAAVAKAFRGDLVPNEAELAEEQGRAYESANQLLARVDAPRPPSAGRRPRSRRVGNEAARKP